MELADRVRLVVDRYWGGSVNKAADAMGIPQQTLNRIVSGQTANPRGQLLARIAAVCQTSVEWLLTGRGVEPPFQDDWGLRTSGSTLRWFRLVDSLGLTPAVRLPVFGLPAGQFNLAERLEPWTTHEGSEERTKRIGWMGSALDLAQESWTYVFEELIARHGVDQLRKELESQPFLVACAYTNFAAFLLRDALGEDEAGRLVERWLQRTTPE